MPRNPPILLTSFAFAVILSTILALPFAPRAHGANIKDLHKLACEGKRRVYDMGRAYETGDGVRQNIPKAFAWYMISIRVGSRDRVRSKERTEELLTTMTSEEVDRVLEEIRNINRECDR